MAKRNFSVIADARPMFDTSEDVARTLRKLRREGYITRLCGPRSDIDRLLRIDNIKAIYIRDEGDGWTVRIIFRRVPGLPQVFMLLPEKGSYPGRAQAQVEMRNALRGMMVRTGKTRAKNR